MPLIIPANSLASGGFAVDNSCRFNSGSTDYLSKTFGSEGNRTTWTWSAWIKRSTLGTEQFVFYGWGSEGNDTRIFFNTDDTLRITNDISNVNNTRLYTTQVFRDVSAWYHIVIVADTDNGTSSNRFKFYINGTLVTSFTTATYPSSGVETFINSNVLHTLGRRNDGASNYFDGYMSEVCFIDGSALDATSFGEFDEDSGIWKPIDVSGLTFGTNGFYLDFKDSAALGDDVSGNGNDFTVNNLTAIDQTTDTPTNNYATFNPLKFSFEDSAVRDPTYSEGNLVALHHEAGHKCPAFSTIASNSGKWYAEVKWLAVNGSYPVNQDTGIINIDAAVIKGWNVLGYFYRGDGTKFVVGSSSSFGDTYTTGDIIGIAMDLDNSNLYFSKNGTWQNSGDPESGATGTGAISIASNIYYAFMTEDYNNGKTALNCGNPPYTISSGNADGNSRGNFEYSVPSGFLSLCTKNLSEILS